MFAQCPQCRGFLLKADDMGFNMVRCTNCNNGYVDDTTGTYFGRRTPEMIQEDIDSYLYKEDEAE